MVLGVFSLFCALVFALIAPAAGHGSAGRTLSMFLMAAFLALVGVTCLTKRGRAVTTRIVAGIVSPVMLLVVANVLFGGGDEPEQGRVPANKGYAVFWLVGGLGCGYYAATGRYPNWAPLDKILSGRDRSPSPPARTPRPAKPAPRAPRTRPGDRPRTRPPAE